MRRGTRKWLIRLVGLTAFGTLCVLVGLRSGRPLFYTDGFSEWFAPSLADAPMLTWPRPEPEMELPGPVEGRVQELPDGRLIYGLMLADGTTDLVLFDPRRPGLPPEPVLGLNSRDHDLAPALGPDNTLYFASDRRGGAGGFDLYAARYANGYFSPVIALGANINGPLDESDPAPDPLNDAVVFVRRDPMVNDGVNGLLYLAGLQGDAPAELVMPLSVKRDPYWQPMDRDPIFSTDGVNLWFVRSFPARPAEPSRIMSTWRLGDHFAGEVVHESLSSEVGLRSPTPLPDGFQLRLVKPGDRALVYVSRAQGVYPWWAGQQLLELVLLGVLLASLVLLVLLLLGQRWSKLDLITQCLLLSLLLHLLILLLLAEKEIVRRFQPDLPGEGALQVELLSGNRASSQGGGELAQVQTNLAAELQFESEQRELSAEAPQAEDAPERVGARWAQGEWPEMAEAALEAEAASMQDERAEMDLRNGADAQLAAEAREVAVAAAQEAELNAQPRAQGTESFQVTLPGTAPEPTSGGAAAAVATATGAQQAAAPEVRDVGQPTTATRDARSSDMPLRSGTGDLATAVAAGQAAQTGQAPAAVRAERARTGGAALQADGPQAPTGLQAAGERPMPVADSSKGALPPSTQVGPPQAVQDQTGLQSEVADLRRAGDPAVAVTATATALAAASQPAPLAATRSTANDGGDPSVELVDVPGSSLAGDRSREAPDADQGEVPQPGNPGMPLAMAALKDSALAGPAKPTRQATGGTDRAVAMATGAVAAERQELRVRATRAPRSQTPLSTGGLPTVGMSAARNRPAPKATRTGDLPSARTQSPPMKLALADVPAAGGAPEATGTPGQPTATADAREAIDMGAVALAAPVAAVVSRPERGLRTAWGFDQVSAGIQVPGSLMERAPRRISDAAEPRPSLAATTPYSNRFGPAKAEALQRFGGTAETEEAVAMGLRYLAGIQQRRGNWGSRRLRDEKYGQVHLGKTGLALLAFLGAGHSPDSDTEYSDVTRRAVQYLISQQDDETGAIGETSAYSHGIATFALVECYGMTKDEALLDPIENALNWILENQSPRGNRRNRGGWGYFSTTYRPEDRYARSSITAWMVMALESARLSGIQIDDEVFIGARDFLRDAFDRDEGYFRYSHDPSRLNSGWPTLPASTPASAFALMLTGEPADDYRIRSALEYTVDRRPTSYRRFSDDQFVMRAAGNVYFWYYGSLACFLAGGEIWEEWNAALSTIIPRAQSEDGSFRPIDVYSEYAGDTEEDRSYTTAMCVLSLEVYYRYFTPLLVGR